MTFRLFTVADTEIRLHVATLPVIMLCVIFGRVNMLAMTSAALFMHELCHVMAAKGRGVAVNRIDVLPCGASAQISESGRSLTDTAAICAAGVLFSLTCGIGITGIMQVTGFENAALRDFALINVILGAVNVLPVQPLDGGRVLHSALSLILSTKSTDTVCTITALGVSCAALSISIYGIYKGVLNLSALLLCALMLTGTVTQIRKKENRAVSALRLMSVTSGGKRVPVSFHAYGQGTEVRDVRAQMDRGKYNVVTVIDTDLRLVGMLDENDLLSETRRGATLADTLSVKSKRNTPALTDKR